jgi:DNA adenine methylase
MQYLGNKSKIADEILEVILKDAKPGQYYVEPFVGSAAVIQRVPNTFKRIGADKNPYLIALLTAVRDGWEPPSTVTEEEYNAIKKNMNAYPKELVGYVGIGASFGGKFFGGFGRHKKDISDPTFVNRCRTALLEDVSFLQGIEFRTGSFISLEVPQDAIVYCDPPYEGTTGYEYVIKNFGDFWNWCDVLVDRGHKGFCIGLF